MTTSFNAHIVEQFLDFLAHDITTHPEHLHTLDSDLLVRVKALVDHIEVDLDVPLSADDNCLSGCDCKG